MLKDILLTLRVHINAVVVIIVGSFSWSLTMIKSGLVYDFGLGFWGANGHDGVWHIALAKSLMRSSNSMPIFAGEQIQNYHLGFDYLLVVLARLTTLPVNTIYFQILPPVLALMAGVTVYAFVINWQNSKARALGALFFVYFGGSLGWLVNLARSGNIDGESMFWAQQSVSTLINPPFALSLVLIFSGLYFLQKGIKTRSKKLLMISTIIFGLCGFVKVYAGILVLGALFIAGIYQQFIRQGITILKVFLGASILSAILIMPVLSEGSSVIQYKPFWFLETMMALSDRLGWDKYFSAMTNYALAGNLLKLVPAYLIAFAIFIMGNFGTRLVAAIYYAPKIVSFAKVKNFSVYALFFLVIIVGGISFPMLFVQSGTPWNTIQFMYYALMFTGVVGGIALADLYVSKNRTKKILAILIVLLTLPTTFATLYFHYLPSRPPAKLSTSELEGLAYLENQPEGIVLTYPFDRDAANAANFAPRDLYIYESTAYVSAYTNKDVYLEDEVNLNITGYPWIERRQEILNWFTTQDVQYAYSFLRERNIKYIYWLKGQRAVLGEEQLGITKIFENVSVDIYKVD